MDKQKGGSMRITRRMIKDLAREYPNKKIICQPEKNPQEVICEIFTAPDNSWSMAVALIIKSVPHFHKTTWETYFVLEGTLRVMGGGTNRGSILLPCKAANIPRTQVPKETTWLSYRPNVFWPEQIHCAWAIGHSPAKVLVIATPAWNANDHHLRPDIIKPFTLR